jgi:hypothetical protein
VRANHARHLVLLAVLKCEAAAHCAEPLAIREQYAQRQRIEAQAAKGM